MIVIRGFGTFKSNKLELFRALEVAGLVLYKVSEPYEEWELLYGEIPTSTNNRIDGKLSVKLKSGMYCNIGVEITTVKDIKNAEAKLRYLIALGELTGGYIYLRNLGDVESDVVKKLNLLREVT